MKKICLSILVFLTLTGCASWKQDEPQTIAMDTLYGEIDAYFDEIIRVQDTLVYSLSTTGMNDLLGTITPHAISIDANNNFMFENNKRQTFYKYNNQNILYEDIITEDGRLLREQEIPVEGFMQDSLFTEQTARLRQRSIEEARTVINLLLAGDDEDFRINKNGAGSFYVKSLETDDARYKNNIEIHMYDNRFFSISWNYTGSEKYTAMHITADHQGLIHLPQ